jgi:hypothetical protein
MHDFAGEDHIISVDHSISYRHITSGPTTSFPGSCRPTDASIAIRPIGAYRVKSCVKVQALARKSHTSLGDSSQTSILRCMGVRSSNKTTKNNDPHNLGRKKSHQCEELVNGKLTDSSKIRYRRAPQESWKGWAGGAILPLYYHFNSTYCCVHTSSHCPECRPLIFAPGPIPLASCVAIGVGSTEIRLQFNGSWEIV